MSDWHRLTLGILVVWSGISLGVVGCSEKGAGSGNRSPRSTASRKAPETVILISLDTLRASRLGIYGYNRETDPHLAQLAKESVVFETCGVQATQTLLSHKSMFTSRYPLRLIREATNADIEALKKLEAPDQFMVGVFQKIEDKMLVSGLQEGKYVTAGFTDGGWMRREMGFFAGFQHFDDQAGHFEQILPRVKSWLDGRKLKVGKLNGGKKEKLFLFLHTYDPHCPYPCRDPYNSRFCQEHSNHIPLGGLCGKPHLVNMDLTEGDMRGISDHYDGGILSTDAYMGHLVSDLKRRGLYDEAMIVVTSDHGESLGEHDQIGHGGLYLEQLLVPLIVKLPKSWNIKPKVLEHPVELLDVMPTIYDACGIKLPEGVDGRSVLPIILSGDGGKMYLIAQMTFREGRDGISNATKRAILDPGRWLLIHDATGERVELFNLRDDPLGLTDISGGKPPAVVGLMKVLAARDMESSDGEIIDPESVEMSEELLRQLKSLGYLD